MSRLIRRVLKDMPLYAILILAAGLRFYKLGQKSLWYDEACSLSLVLRPTFDILKDANVLRPAYFIFMKIWTFLFGIGEINSRIPSVLFGVAAVFLIYETSKALFDEKTGLCAAFLLSISYYHIAWSQQVRYYSLFLLTCLASNVFYLKLLVSGRLKDYFWYGIATIFAILTFPFAIFVLLLQGIQYSIYSGRTHQERSRSMVIISLVFVILVFLAIVLFSGVLKENMPAADIIEFNPHNMGRLLGTFNHGGGRIAEGATAHRMDASTAKYHALLNIIFTFFYLYGIAKGLSKQGSDSLKIVYLLLWQWLPLLALFFLSCFGLNLFSIRYLIFTLPAYYIIVAQGITQFIHRKMALSIILLFVFFVNAPSFVQYYHPASFASWRELAGDLKKEIGIHDGIVLAPLQQITPFWFYYKHDLARFGLIGNGINGKGIMINGRWQDRFSDGDIDVRGVNFGKASSFIQEMAGGENRNKRGNLWLVVSPYWLGKEEYGLLIAYLSHNFKILEEKEYPFEGLKLLRFNKHAENRGK